MNQPFVSILMTAFNRQQFIAEAIQSVIESTYQNWELIIVDDASKDNTVAIAKSFAEKDNRIQLYINENNLGDYPNRNKAASLAKGKYLKYVDSDDTIYSDALENMVRAMEQFPQAEWGFGSLVHTITEPVCLSHKEAYEFHYFNNPVFFASPGMAIISKSAFAAVNGFDFKRMVSDFDMWHKLSAHSPVVLIPGNIVHIRTHNQQEVTQQKDYVLEYEKIKLQYISRHGSPLSKEQVKQIKRRRRNTVFKIAVNKIIKLDVKAAIPRLKVFWFYLWN